MIERSYFFSYRALMNDTGNIVCSGHLSVTHRSFFKNSDGVFKEFEKRAKEKSLSYIDDGSKISIHVLAFNLI